MAAERPLKLTVRDSARDLFMLKFLMQRTKQIVLNQEILQPAIKQSPKTCHLRVREQERVERGRIARDSRRSKRERFCR